MSKKALHAAFAACLFLLVVGAKWATFDRYGSPMPDWDQWDAEAGELFIPWFDGDHFVAHLFHPHNEHRVILTKLQNLALGLLNGQWDSRLEAASNAVLHAALAVAFWVFGCRCVRAAVAARRAIAPEPVTPPAREPGVVSWQLAVIDGTLFLLVLALFALPLAWQNVLGGFHSQQYWLLGLSFAAIVTFPFARPWSAAWWTAGLAATLALGSMGSGFLAAAVVCVVVIWRLLRRETHLRAAWPTLGWTLVLIAAGWFTRVEVPWHQGLKATSAREFFLSIVHSLEWPLRDDRDWAALVLWIPWLLVAWRVATAPATHCTPVSTEAEDTAAGRSLRCGQTILALGGWVIVQVVATAYARGVGADYPASRYMDTLAFGALANAVALGWLLATGCVARVGRYAHATVALGWLATFGSGIHSVADRNFRWELPDAKKYYVGAEAHMRCYLASNDRKALAYPDIPYPSADGLIDRLVHSRLRAMMPVPIRAPLALRPAAPSGVFIENDVTSCGPEPLPRHGLAPGMPPLDAAVTWGSFAGGDSGGAATGTWRSAPLQATLRGWLKFETAGFLGEPNGGVALELRDAATDAFLARIRPSKIPGETWRSAYVRAPKRPFVVVAHDRHAARWFAFSGPVEMGSLSYWAWRVTKNGLLVVYVAAAAALGLALLAWKLPPQTSKSSRNAPDC